MAHVWNLSVRRQEGQKLKVIPRYREFLSEKRRKRKKRRGQRMRRPLREEEGVSPLP